MVHFGYTHAQMCGNDCVQKATPWCGSVHTLHMSKPCYAMLKSLCHSCLHSLSFMIRVWRSLIWMKKFQTEKSGAKTSKIRDVWNVSFCCKLHRNLMIHENVMLQLHGKTHTKWVFSPNPHVFTCLHFFCKKMKVLHKETTANHENMMVFTIRRLHAH